MPVQVRYARTLRYNALPFPVLPPPLIKKKRHTLKFLMLSKHNPIYEVRKILENMAPVSIKKYATLERNMTFTILTSTVSL
jgi:hypothetical protein